MTESIRLAIIGCGQIGRVHTERLLADGRARIAALCDPAISAAERLRDELVGEAQSFGDVAAMLDAVPLDAAIICTPTHLHYGQVRALWDRGVPVLCEKPLADTRERIVELIDLARGGSPLLSLAYQRRYWATIRTLRREVQSGRWGAVKSITSYNAERWQQTIAGTWRDDPRFNPGGFLGDAGSHKLDLLFFVTGLRPVEVFAHSDRRGSRVEIVTTLSARLTGDVALGMNFVGDAEHFREDFHVHCEGADLCIRERQVWVCRENRIEKIAGLEPETNPDVAFLDCLTCGAANAAPADCALPVWDFTHAILESARTQRLVTLPLPSSLFTP